VRRKPNFLLFITDQHRADFLGCYGHPIVKTPNIDSIAARGVAFDRFFVASPVCMPNRSSLMTGRMPSVHGVRCNGIPLTRDAVTFVDLLRDAGYSTALVGKSHLQNFTSLPPLVTAPAVPAGYYSPSEGLRSAIRNGFGDPAYMQEEPDFWAKENPKVATPFYGFDRVDLVTGHGDAVGGDYIRWLRERAPNADELLGPRNSLPHDYACPQAYRTAVPAELYPTAFVGDRAEDFLRNHATGDGDRPFFLMVSFPDPHHPFNPPGHYWDMYDPDDFPVPEAFTRNDWTPPPHVRAAIEQRERGEADLQGMRTISVSAREAQEARALTAGMITCIDDAIGGVLTTLDASGLREETVVIFTTDHGDHLGDHRLLLKGPEQYQSIVRVPLIWSDPELVERPSRSGALASTIDISATILDRAQLAPYAGLQGVSLLPNLRGRVPTHRDAVLIQYEHQASVSGSSALPRIHSLIDGRWRISVFQNASWGELYDIENDPGEFENLWESPCHADVRALLTERLLRAEIECIDRVPLPTARA
jgi:arylsulfatase A-like enzyme